MSISCLQKGSVAVKVKRIELPMVAESTNECSSIFTEDFCTVLWNMILHEGEVWSLLALCMRVQHAGKTQFRVKSAEKAVEGRGGRLVGGVHRCRGVNRDWGVAGWGLTCDSRRMGVGV